MTDRFENHSVASGNGLAQNSSEAITEADVLITAALTERPTRQPDLAAENQALRTLAQQLMDEPQALLKALVQIAKDLCQADMAGVSFLETLADGTSVFRWIAIAGTLESLEQTTVPADFSPCGTTIRSGQSQLYAHPERYFTYLQDAQLPVAEALLSPFFMNNRPLGTLWLVSHQEQRQFDHEDQRLMMSLSGFTAAALQSIYLRKMAEQALRREQETRTQQEQAETSLHQSEALKQQILDSSDDCIKVLDLSGRLLYMSPKGQALLGIQEMTLFLNACWVDFWLDADRQAALIALDTAKAGGVGSFQAYCPTLAGEPKWWDVRLTPIRGAAGQVERLLCISRDITERRQSEDERHQNQERLRESEERLSAIFSQAAVGLSEISLDGYFQRVNNEICHILRKSRQEMLTTSMLDVTHPEDISRSVEAFQQLIATGQPVSIDKRYQRSDGTIVWANSSLTRLDDEQGRPHAVLAVTVDLSDRKRAELNTEFLAAVSQDLVGASSVSEIIQTVGDHLHRYLNISICAFVDINAEADEAVVHHAWHQVNAPSLVGIYPLPDFVSQEFLQAIKAGQSIVVRDVATDPRIAAPERFAALKIRSFINVPIIRDNQWKFTLGVYHQAPYDWRSEEIELIRELSARIWNGIERTRAEEALRQSESRLRLIIESAKDYAIFTLDLNGTIASWNSGAERLLGYTEAEAIGCHGRTVFTPEDNAHGRAEWEMETALTQGRAEDERWHIRKDNSRFWASGLMMPLQDEVGNVQGFVKIMQDKTAQRRANERFQLLYDTTSDLLATEQPLTLMHNLFSKLSVQLELHCYYNFLVEENDNRLMLHLRNYEGIPEEVARRIEWIELGESLCGLVAQQRQQIVLNREQIATRPSVELVDSIGITAYACQPLIAHGRLLGALSFGSCTRTRFTPEEIHLLQSTCDQIAIAIDRANLIASIQQQAEQLQQANRIKDEFLAVLSHELRSPLNPILGWSKLLQDGKLDAAKTAQALATIERNAKLQSKLIEDLLDVSRILRGKVSLNVSPVDLASIIKLALETVRLAAEAKSIAVEVNITSNVRFVSGDSTRLQQVVWNLLSNAVKFTPICGRVVVQLEQVDNQAQITVSDNGKGIPPEFLPHVFDYFRQADSATTRQFGGLGLGLAIVRHLVELHGGTVKADSLGEGRGATFIVKLPLMPMGTAKNQQQQSSQPSLDLQGVHVLVVDDEPDTRDLVVFVLEQAGASVISASSASGALVALMQSKPDILVSDIGMPDMDGYMLIRQVRALPDDQGGQIPAIALTAYVGEMNQQQAIAAGFQRHLAKPVEPTELITSIADLCEQKGGNA